MYNTKKETKRIQGKRGGAKIPYIDKTRRKAFDTSTLCVSNPGELNYLLTQVCQEYLEIKGEKYSTYNDIVGALESCKLEIYRRKIAPYEDKKIRDNGDVWL